MLRKTFQAGEVIFEQGAYANTMYEIAEGSVGIFADHGTPSERQLATLETGAFFGEMGLVECYPRSATAVALTNSTVVCEIDASEFASFYQDQPHKVLEIMRQLSERLRTTNERYLEACRTVYGAIEAERAGAKPTASVVRGLSAMLKRFRPTRTQG